MESRAKYILVGAVVVFMSVAFVAAVLWITDAASAVNMVRYTIYFKEHNLDGLQRDGDVTMKGIRVGSVEDFEISDKDIEQVKVTVSVYQGTPVKRSTRAVLRSNLLTGFARIDLVGSSSESQSLKAIRVGEEYPVIPEGTRPIDAIANSLPSLLDDFGETIKSVNAVFSDKNREAVTSILENLSKVSEDFAASSGDVRELLGSVDKLSVQVTEIGKKLTDAAKSANSHVNQISTEAKQALRQIQKTAKTIEEKAETLGNDWDNVSEVALLEIGSIAQAIRAASESISAAAAEFQDPKGILLGPDESALGPGERLAR